MTGPRASAARNGVDDLAPALERFTSMPPAFATYEVDADATARALRCTAADVLQLCDKGLAHARTASGPLFDPFDVMNLGRFSGTGTTVPELVARALLRFSSRPPDAWLGPKRWEITVTIPPAVGAGRACTVRLPDYTSAGIVQSGETAWPRSATRTRSGYTVDVTVEGNYDPVRDRRAREVYDEVFADLRSGAVNYQAVSESMRSSHWTAWRSGIADCMVTSRVLADRLRDAGVQARARRGFLLGLVGSEHAWCEAYEDGRWKTIEVTLAAMPTGLTTGRRSAAHDVFSSYGLGGRLNRCLPCTGHDADALMHDDDGTPLPMMGVISARDLEPSR